MIFSEYYFILSLPFIILCYRWIHPKIKEYFLGGIAVLSYLSFGLQAFIFTVFTALNTFFFAILLQTLQRKRKRAFLFGILLFFLLFLVWSKGRTQGSSIGISYYSLMAIGYLIEAYNGREIEKNPYRLWMVLSFFPLMLQGPISDFYELRKEITEEKIRLSEQECLKGISRIFLGYFKKLVIADRLTFFLSLLFQDGNNRGFTFFITLLLYSLRLIMDFTGGIDLVIGISTLMGIRINENFKKPLLALSLSDFWNRWHISLSVWFKKYVFYPVSVSLIGVGKLSFLSKKNKKRVAVYSATLITWSLTGLWHGFHLNFFLWGLSNAFLLIFSYELKDLFKRFHQKFGTKFSTSLRYVAMVRTFFLVSLLRAFDQYRDPKIVGDKMIHVQWNWNILRDNFEKSGLHTYHLMLLSIAVIFVIYQDYKKSTKERFVFFVFKNCVLLISILLFGAYGKSFEWNSFIYSRF